MSPESKRAVAITAGTLIPLGSIAGIIAIVWAAAGVNKTVEAHTTEIQVLTLEQKKYRQDVEELKINMAIMSGAMGLKYKIVPVTK